MSPQPIYHCLCGSIAEVVRQQYGRWYASADQCAALRDFDPAYDRFGSVASHPDLRDAPGMSAMPPLATASVRRNKTLLCANSGSMHRSKRRG